MKKPRLIQTRRAPLIATLALFTATTAQLGSAQLGMDAPATPKSTILYSAQPQTVPAGRQADLELRF